MIKPLRQSHASGFPLFGALPQGRHTAAGPAGSALGRDSGEVPLMLLEAKEQLFHQLNRHRHADFQESYWKNNLSLYIIPAWRKS